MMRPVLVSDGFRCRLCGRAESTRPERCPGCHSHGTYVGFDRDEGEGDLFEPVELIPYDRLSVPKRASRLLAFHPAFDPLFNGGLQRSGTYLIYGEWGAGKSTLALQLVEKHRGTVRYVCAEEPAIDVKARAERLGLKRTEHLYFAESEVIEPALEEGDPCDVNVIDSLHGLRSEETDGNPGEPHVVSAVIRALVRYTRETKGTSIILGHLSKDGAYKGPTEAPHAVTAVTELEKQGDGRVCWKVKKNRHGPTQDRIDGIMIPRALVLEMTDRGLIACERGDDGKEAA